MSAASKKYPIEELHLDERLQARASLDQSVVDEYAEAYRAKADMPPVDVYVVDGRKLVVDGWHRIAGARLADGERAYVRAVTVGTGTIDQAIWHALAANRTHGLRRSNADKRRAVWLALESQIGAEQSSRVIAEHVGVGDDLVSKIRAEYEAERFPRFPEENATQATGQVPENDTCQPKRRVGRDGKSYPVKPKAPKTRVIPEPEDVGHEYPVESDEPLPHEPELADLPQGDKSPMPSYGPELERVATAIGRLRVECRRATLPNSILQSVESGLKSVESALRFAVPETCPRCSGAKCLHCRQRGWVEKSEGDGLRAAVRSAAR
jgi:hypothetical protein